MLDSKLSQQGRHSESRHNRGEGTTNEYSDIRRIWLSWQQEDCLYLRAALSICCGELAVKIRSLQSFHLLPWVRRCGSSRERPAAWEGVGVGVNTPPTVLVNPTQC